MSRVAHAGTSSSASKSNSGLDESTTLAGMLLAAALAALLVVADQLIETWSDGHLLVGWVALWTVVFAVLAVSAPALRALALAASASITHWVRDAVQRYFK